MKNESALARDPLFALSATAETSAIEASAPPSAASAVQNCRSVAPSARAATRANAAAGAATSPVLLSMTHAFVAQSPAPAPASVKAVPASAYASVTASSAPSSDTFGSPAYSTRTPSKSKNFEEPPKSARRAAATTSLAGASHRLTYISSTFVTCSGGTTNAETAATTPAPVRAARPPGTIRAAFAAKKSANAATPKIAPET